jgi:hypothetical protein
MSKLILNVKKSVASHVVYIHPPGGRIFSVKFGNDVVALRKTYNVECKIITLCLWPGSEQRTLPHPPPSYTHTPAFTLMPSGSKSTITTLRDNSTYFKTKKNSLHGVHAKSPFFPIFLPLQCPQRYKQI